VCANVLCDYINGSSGSAQPGGGGSGSGGGRVPWDDLRYIVGEIMYG
jgi:hypothetical protein